MLQNKKLLNHVFCASLFFILYYSFFNNLSKYKDKIKKYKENKGCIKKDSGGSGGSGGSVYTQDRKMSKKYKRHFMRI